MTIRSGRELLWLQLCEPAGDAGVFAGRVVDFLCDQAVLVVVEAWWVDPGVDVGERFVSVFDALLVAVFDYLGRVNPRGAAYLRAGIGTFVD